MGLDQHFYKTNRENIGYFRKVNFLQGYMEAKYSEMDLNCQYVYFSKEMADEILDYCKQIMEHVTYPEAGSQEDPIWTKKAEELAAELLPTQAGFFYGNTLYDAWYFHDVKDVHDYLEKLIKETDWDNDTIEYSCWY